jgi:predicted NUDIX family phosphoesterase
MGMGGTMMATTSAERMREHRTRRHRRDIQLKIDVSETELREIALRGYAGAASANRKAREAAVALFVSDQCFNLATEKRGGRGA